MEPGPVVIIGVLARVDVATRGDTRLRLERLEGVSTFDLASPDKLGVLIEASDVDAAHATLQQQVGHTPGVLAVWPVSIESDGFEPRESNESQNG
ncbi:MAG: hypothetical protein IPM29_08225 [Planctomycetes bacterium]|nr:hypothetical protein [Planctomycetota bacterium]